MATKNSPVAKPRKKASTRKSSKGKTTRQVIAKVETSKKKTTVPQVLKLIRNDRGLQPYAEAIEGRHQRVKDKLFHHKKD